MKVKPALFVLSLIFGLLIVAVGCSGGGTKTIITTEGTFTATIKQMPITIPITTYSVMKTTIPGDLIIVIGGGYADATTNVGQGQKFEWVNMDHEAHTVTAIGRYGGLFDFTLLPGESVEYSFKNPDTYNYYDKLHPGESAVITVDSIDS